MMEPHFKPHGWLKFHLSDRLRLDFSNDDVFHGSVKKLLNTLRKVFSSVNTAVRKFYRRLATALKHAYDVIEMCAPAAPPIRLAIPNPNPNPIPKP